MNPKNRPLVIVALSAAALILLIVGSVVIGPVLSDRAAAPPAGTDTAARPSEAKVVRTVTLEIEGMHCDGCVKRITEFLEKTPGVVSAKVLLEEEKAIVGMSDENIDIGLLVAAVTDAGYTATLAE